MVALAELHSRTRSPARTVLRYKNCTIRYTSLENLYDIRSELNVQNNIPQ